MRDYHLGFISNEDIYNHVRETVRLYSSRMDLKKFNKNLIDPIKLTFDQKVLGNTIDAIVMFECLRQEDKSNNNHIGYFHQKLFNYAGNGWTAYVKSLDYFKAPSKYFGTYAEVSEKATNDFLAACEQIDESMIVPLLRVGEAFNILLYIDGMGTVVCGITINAEPEYNSENEE